MRAQGTDRAAESRATYDAVVSSLHHWDPRAVAQSGRGFTERLRDYLDTELNPPGRGYWDRDIVEVRHGTYSVDVAVNGVIGVVLAGGSHAGDLQQLRQFIGLYAQSHEYLVVYVGSGDSNSERRWRSFEWRYTPQYLGVSDITYVHYQPPTLVELPTTTIHPHALIVLVAGLLLSVGALGIAPGAQGVLTAALTLLVAVVLAVVFHYAANTPVPVPPPQTRR